MKKAYIFLFSILPFLLFTTCEYEQLHELIAIDFETEVNCYWATFTPTSDVTGDYFWDFGDGDTSMQKKPRHIYDLAGQYEVTLRIVNEKGGGKTSKNITIKQPSDDTFRTDNESIGSYGNSFQENFSGGYDVLVTDFSNKLTSLYRFSTQGAFQEKFLEGTRTRDFVASYGSEKISLDVTNNLNDGTIDFVARAALEGVYSFLLGEENKYVYAKKVLWEDEKRNAFVLSIYGEDENIEEGILIDNPFYRGRLKIPLAEVDFTNLFFDISMTPDKGLLLAYSLDGIGIHILKTNQLLEKEWETYLPNITFEKGDPNFNIVDAQEPISIVALSEEEYILVVADADRYFHTDPGIFDADPKTYILRGNQDQIDWKITKNRIPSANALTIAANGDIVLSGSLATDRQRFSSTYLFRLTAEGTTIFEKVIDELNIAPKEIIETPQGNFLILGRALDFLQVDCGGNF